MVHDIPPGNARVLVVDDDPAIRLVVEDRFRALGYQIESARDGVEALEKIDAFEPDVVLLDLRMPRVDGFAVLEALAPRTARPQVIVITAHGSIGAAVQAVKLGASDFISKPFEPAHLQHLVRKTLEARGLERRVQRLETEVSERHSLVSGQSPGIREALSLARRAAASDATVMLLGESGSGKEVLARYVHRESSRASGPFVAVNCATLSKELLQSELFGHERGAFTGAVKSRLGRLEQANGGTLFLDEIGEIEPEIQAKLLRVLQEREFERLGGSVTLTTDARIVCATHRDLPRAIREGRFREDLFYRLNVVAIRVLPLRQRREDVGPLLDHFLAKHSGGVRDLRITSEARDCLTRYSWPGNVRELANVVERMVVLRTADVLGVDDLPEEVRDGCVDESSAAAPAPHVEGSLSYHDAVREAKRSILRRALEQNENVQTRAARQLGITQPYMARLIKNLDLRRK